MLQDDFEAVIIGGGPAGLSAALVLGRCLRRTLVCDDGRYRNKRSRAHHCFMGHDGADPARLLADSRRQLACYETVTLASMTAWSAGALSSWCTLPIRAKSLQRRFWSLRAWLTSFLRSEG